MIQDKNENGINISKSHVTPIHIVSLILTGGNDDTLFAAEAIATILSIFFIIDLYSQYSTD